MGPDFLHHRELLGELSRAAFETVRDLMARAAGHEYLRPGMVAAVHSSGDLLQWHPHVHALASRGGWGRDGRWIPIPYLHTRAAELLFRHKVLAFLKKEGLLSEERLELLVSWQPHTGFSAHNAVTVAPEDPEAVERLARYLLRPPLSLERMSFDAKQGVVHYRRNRSGRFASAVKAFDPLDFLARLLMHVPEPRLHTVRYYGHDANVVRARRPLPAAPIDPALPHTPSAAPTGSSTPVSRRHRGDGGGHPGQPLHGDNHERLSRDSPRATDRSAA